MNLLFIISGSIAAIKCKDILKKLSKKEYHINCIVTDSAKKIIKIKEINKYIKGKIYIDSDEKQNKMLHIRLTRKSNLIIVCPATANLIAKYAHGFADDLASTALIASNKQVVFMPAMNAEMWNNKINKNNVEILQKTGVEFIGPNYGYLSCGEVGIGRLADQDKIIEIIQNYLKRSTRLRKIKCLVTAGPTIELIDPIRYISNNSSGKQGYEIAKQLMLQGGKVTLISGPTNLQPPNNVKLIKVKNAYQMKKAIEKNKDASIAVFTAAVSDVSPSKISKHKIKKNKLSKIILKKNPDIIKSISMEKNNQLKYVVGFAAETENYILNAKKKLIEKNCDLIVLNKINKTNNVFGSEFNRVAMITKNSTTKLKKMTKTDVAKILSDKIIHNFNKKIAQQ